MTLGARSVVVSLGRDGALLVDSLGALHASASVTNPKSTVGAGDALLAGYLAGSSRAMGIARTPCGRPSPGARPLFAWKAATFPSSLTPTGRRLSSTATPTCTPVVRLRVTGGQHKWYGNVTLGPAGRAQ